MPTLPKSKSRPWIPKKPKHFRETDNASFYSSKRWKSLRNFFIQKFPICAQCKRNGELNNAQVVDHVVPIRLGGSPIDQKNLQSLCNPCHNKKSGMEGAEYRKSIKIKNNER